MKVGPKMEYGGSVREPVYFDLESPPYNMRRFRGDGNQEHDWFFANGMRTKVQLCEDALKPFRYDTLFYLLMQLWQ